MTLEEIIREFEEKYALGQEFLDHLEAYVAARQLRMLENAKRMNVPLNVVEEYLADDIRHWMGG